MRQWTWSFAVAATLVTAYMAPGQEASKDKDDLAKLQGTWVVDPVTYKGFEDKEGFKEVLKDIQAMRFVFENEQLAIKHPPGNEEKPLFRLDPSKKPKQIDLSDGVQGIYELEGETLKLCWDKQAKKRGRPTRFAHGKDDDLHYYVLRRAKK